MLVSNKHKVAVNADFDSGTFLGFSITSTKNQPNYGTNNTNLKIVENLTFEDFTVLELLIAETVSKFLDMKYQDKKVLDETKGPTND